MYGGDMSPPASRQAATLRVPKIFAPNSMSACSPSPRPAAPYLTQRAVETADVSTRAGAIDGG